MQLKIKLKKRWLTTVLNESATATDPMPWQRRRQEAKGRPGRSNRPWKPSPVRA